MGIDAEELDREDVDRRIGVSAEIADVVQFLASPAASFVNGETVAPAGVPDIIETAYRPPARVPTSIDVQRLRFGWFRRRSGPIGIGDEVAVDVGRVVRRDVLHAHRARRGDVLGPGPRVGLRGEGPALAAPAHPLAGHAVDPSGRGLDGYLVPGHA